MIYNSGMTATSLHDWLQTPLGRYVLEREHIILDEAMADVFGFNALQASLIEIHALRANRIPNQMMQFCSLTTKTEI